MNTYRLARLVAILLFLAAALYFLGGLIVGISVWNRGLGAGWGSGFAGWLSIPIFIGTFFAALTLLMFGVVLYFLAAINDHLTAARLNKARSPARPTPPPAPPAPSRAEPPRTASPFAPPSAPAHTCRWPSVGRPNVPHAENISYFGEPLPETGSTDEAQMVYNFSLAPLTLHALQTGDATRLSRWAATLRPPASGAAFFNFIASHDGIGVLPARGILSEAEVQGLVAQTLDHGGQVSYKANGDGTTSVYELNTTLYDFLNDPAHPDPERDVPRFLASQAILLSLAGVPGIYVHSLFGSRNCRECFAATGRSRSLNRRKFDLAGLEAILADPERHEGRVFDAYRRLLRLRRAEPAFHPAGGQQVLDLGPGVFAVLRTPPADAGRPVLCLVSVSSRPQTVALPADLGARGPWRDLIGASAHPVAAGATRIELAPYQACWLVPVPAA